jgi:hypothetical protein
VTDDLSTYGLGRVRLAGATDQRPRSHVVEKCRLCVGVVAEAVDVCTNGEEVHVTTGAVECVKEQRRYALGRDVAHAVEVVLLAVPAAPDMELVRRLRLEEARGSHEIADADALTGEGIQRCREQIRPIGRVLLRLGIPGEDEAADVPRPRAR